MRFPDFEHCPAGFSTSPLLAIAQLHGILLSLGPGDRSAWLALFGTRSDKTTCRYLYAWSAHWLSRKSQFVRPAANPCKHGKEETASEIYLKERNRRFWKILEPNLGVASKPMCSSIFPTEDRTKDQRTGGTLPDLGLRCWRYGWVRVRGTLAVPQPGPLGSAMVLMPQMPQILARKWAPKVQT